MSWLLHCYWRWQRLERLGGSGTASRSAPWSLTPALPVPIPPLPAPSQAWRAPTSAGGAAATLGTVSQQALRRCGWEDCRSWHRNARAVLCPPLSWMPARPPA